MTPRNLAVSATTSAATQAAMVPFTLIPPSSPAGTGFQFVIKTVLPGKACPVSLDEVSAATSASDARASRRNGGGQTVTISAATPTLAITCEAERPLFDSATCNCSLRERPMRVAARVTAKTTSSTAKSLGSVAAITKATPAPAQPPEPFTPWVSQAASAKTRVIVTAKRRRLREEFKLGQRRSAKRVAIPAAKLKATASAVWDWWVLGSVLSRSGRRRVARGNLSRESARHRMYHNIVLFGSPSMEVRRLLEGSLTWRLIADVTLSLYNER